MGRRKEYKLNLTFEKPEDLTDEQMEIKLDNAYKYLCEILVEKAKNNLEKETG